MRRSARAVLVGLALAGASPSVAAQIVGDVVDEARRPVRGAAIGLFDEGGAFVGQARSDASGHFLLDTPSSGRYRLHVAHPGYRSVSGGPYDVDRGVGLEVLVVLHTVAVELDELEVVVEGRAPRLVSTGFYEREAKGLGTFFHGEQLRRSAVGGLTEFLARLPWIERTNPGTPFGPNSVRNPALYYERGGFSCVPSLWLDGALVRDGGSMAEPLRLDDWVSAADVAGLEFYGGPSTVPIEFARSASCAVLVVWTRIPGRGGGGLL